MTIEIIKKPMKRQRSESMAAMVVVSRRHHDDDQENPGFLDTRRRGGYECKTCGKRFKSFQALGGHQGIHKKVKPTTVGDDSFDECELRLDIVVDPNKSSFGLYQCKQCMKEFDSGQALGGHMRRHRRPVIEKHNLANSKQQEEEIVRRQQAAAASDEQAGKSDLTHQEPPEEVSRLLKKADQDDYERRIIKMMRSHELILAATEWRLSII